MRIVASLVEMQRLLTVLNPFSSPLDPSSPTASPGRLVLFGADQPWNTSDLTWAAVTDQVRGGSSTASLSLRDSSYGGDSTALFAGHLDTSTLGGAGFASVTTKPAKGDAAAFSGSQSESSAKGELLWDLAAYDGIELVLAASDSQRYALTLKDDVPADRRGDGREKSAISWEAVFTGPGKSGVQQRGQDGIQAQSALRASEEGSANETIWLPWDSFVPTYRGRDKNDTTPLRTDHILRFGLMMRSFFDKQSGDFGLEIREIAARKVLPASLL